MEWADIWYFENSSHNCRRRERLCWARLGWVPPTRFDHLQENQVVCNSPGKQQGVWKVRSAILTQTAKRSNGAHQSVCL